MTKLEATAALRAATAELEAVQEALRTAKAELRAVKEALRASSVERARTAEIREQVVGCVFESVGADVLRIEGDLHVLFPEVEGSRAEVSCDWLAARIHPHDREKARLLLSRIGETGGHHIGFRIRIGDERYRHVFAYAHRSAFDGTRPGSVAGAFFVFFGSIDALLCSRSRLDMLLSRLPNAIVSVLDEELNFVKVYGQELRRLDLKLEDVLGRSIDELYPPDKAALIRRECTRALDEDRIVSFENSFGAHVYLVSVMPIPSATSAGRELLVLSTNITEKQHAEQTLVRAKTEAERASHARLAFLASMSHELRTPLAGMLGIIDLLADSSVNRESESQALLAQLRGLVVEQERHIADLLDFSRIDANKLVLENEQFGVRDAFAGLFRQVQADSDSEAVINVELPAEQMTFVGDPMRIRQVVSNLVGNAIKYTKEGEVSVQIGVSVSGELLIEVADTGVGIPAESLDKIFEIYARADDAKTYARGWGIGLVVVRRIIEQMGGTISVESVVGEGSTFRARIPPAEVPLIGADDRHARADSRPLAGRHVLVVEDNDVIRMVVCELLRRDKVVTTVVECGTDAEQAIEDTTFDAILMDLNLPDRSGLDLIRWARDRETSGVRTPIIALTALGYEEDRNRSLRAGADVHLTKPVSHDTLRRTLLRLLEVRADDETTGGDADTTQTS